MYERAQGHKFATLNIRVAKISGPLERPRAMLTSKVFLHDDSDDNDNDSDDNDLSFIDHLIPLGIVLGILNIIWHVILTRIQLRKVLA